MKTRLYAHIVQLSTLLLCFSTFVNAQQLKLGDNPGTIQKSALLELDSKSQGLLLPRISDTTSATIKASPDGMIIFLTLNNSLCIRANGGWHKLIPQGEAITSMNGSTSEAQTITATNNAAPASMTTVGANHFLNLPDAAVGYSGFMGTGTQTFAGAKSFNGNLSAHQEVFLTGITLDNTKDSVLLIDGGKVWKKRLTGLPPSGTAGGDLTGTYPNPRIAQAGATTGQALKWNGTTWAPAADAGITSISMNLGGPFFVTPTTLTANGTFNIGMNSQAANTVFASPNGSAGTADFRSLVAADIPNLPFSKITGTVPISQGGTGLTAVGANGTILTSNGTSLVYAPAPAATLSGDITGLISSNTIAAGAVSFAKMQNINTQRIMGRYTGGLGIMQEVSLDNTVKLNTGGTLYADSALTIWNASKLQGRGVSPNTPVTGQVLKYNGTIWAAATDDNTTGLTSVGLTMPSLFTVTGSPLTANGTIAVTIPNQNANTVYAGPGTGAAAQPTFRTLAAADIPNLPFSKITGTVPVSQGGTGLTAVGANGTVLTSNGTSLVYSALPSTTLAGDVTGATGSNTIANSAVTYAKLQDVTGQRLLGRYAATTGNAQEITLNNSLKLNTAGTLYADSSLSIWNSSRIQGNIVSGKVPTSGQVLKWNSTTNIWEPNTDNDGGATYGDVGNSNDAAMADVAGSTTRMKIWNSATNGTVINGPLGTNAHAWSIMAFRGGGFTTHLYFDKNTMAIKEWGGNTAPLTTNAGNIWYKMVQTNGDINIANGSILFGYKTSDATSEVSQNNANFFWDNANRELGIRTNTPTASIDVNGDFKLGAAGTVLDGIIKTSASFNSGTTISGTNPLYFNVNVPGAQVNATVIVNPRGNTGNTTGLPNGLAIGWARVTTANTVTIKIVNTGNNTTTGNVTYDITLIQ